MLGKGQVFNAGRGNLVFTGNVFAFDPHGLSGCEGSKGYGFIFVVGKGVDHERRAARAV